MFQMLKNAFIDKDTGSFKISSVVAAVGGAFLGNMLLGPMMGGMLGGMGGILAPALGAVALVAGKEMLLPMIMNRGQANPAAQPGHHQTPQQQHQQGHHVPPQQPHHGLPGQHASTGHGGPHDKTGHIQK